MVIAAVTVVALVLAVWVVSRPGKDTTGTTTAVSCQVADTVRVTVAPEVGALVQGLLSGPIPVGAGQCTVAEVATQEPLQTLAMVAGQDYSTGPQLWIPDDVSWAARAGAAVADTGVVLAQTAVVLTTSRSVALSRGWLTAAPATWSQALGAADVVLADPVAEAEGLRALGAVQADLGPGEAADTALTQLVLTASGPAAVTAAVTAAVNGSTDAPVVVATEHQVGEATAGGVGDLVVVVPTEGAPVLQLPVLQVAGTERNAAIDAVSARLAEAAHAGDAVRAAGWRDAAGREAGSGSTPLVLTTDLMDMSELATQVASLMTPSRLHTVVDVSLSMGAAVGEGTRATVARDALTSALSVLPDQTTGGLWIFASRLVGDQDWQEVIPARPFGTVEDGETQRMLLAEEFAALPDRLSGGGTGLYDTVLAAVRAARAGYDVAAVNTVVLLTDGTDDDPTGISQQDLLTTLAAEADDARPVQVVAVGIGPDTDLTALRSIVEVTGGATYAATVPDDLRTILFDAVRLRP